MPAKVIGVVHGNIYVSNQKLKHSNIALYPNVSVRWKVLY